MADHDDPDQNADHLADETLLGAMHDITSDQARAFYAAVARGELDFDPGQPGAGIPPVLSPLHGRRRDRALRLAQHPEEPDPSLYGGVPEEAYMCAMRAVLWVAHHAPEHPVRLTPSRTGMLRATYALPGAVTVTNLLLFDQLTGAEEAVVTAESLAEAARWAQPSPGNAVTGPGLALEEHLLAPTDEHAPAPVPDPERAATHRVLQVPLEGLSLVHQLLPLPPGSPDEALPVPGASRGGQERVTPVSTSTLAAIGWLDPFAPDPEVDPDEMVLLGVGGTELYWWGFKTALATPRPPAR